MSEVNFHYAYILGQTIEIDDLSKDLVLQKCLTSFLISLHYCVKHYDVSHHTVGIFYKSYDQKHLISIIDPIVKKYSNDKIVIEYHDVSQQGINGNLILMEQGFHWLQSQGKQFVFNVQDNYLFSENTIYEMFVISNQVKFATGFDILAGGINHFSLWLAAHGSPEQHQVIKTQNSSTWINYFNLSDSFMTTHYQFSQHWEVYVEYFKSISANKELDLDSLNLRLMKKQIHTLVPLENLLFLMDSNIINHYNSEWKTIWDNTDVSF